MSNIKEILIHGLLCAVITFFLVFGFVLEDPYIKRGLVLLALSILFIIITVLVYSFNKFERITIVEILLLTFILAIIEYYSKYSMNYLYHSLYFAIVLLVILYSKHEIGIYIAIIVTLASLIKFVQLLLIETTQSNVANFIFYAVVQILLISTVFTAKAYYSESIKTKQLYKELLDAYQKLNEYSRDIEILSAKEERSSIARDLHDTLGHELTGLIMQLELATYNFSSDNEALGKQYLNESIQNARNSLTKVRMIVDTLRNQEKLVFVNQSLGELIREYQKRTGIDVELVMNKEESVRPEQLLLLYRVIQEALTNTAKHSQNKNMKIIINFSVDNINFHIYDYLDKKGVFRRAKKVQRVINGNGLNGMNERINEVNGSVTFSKYSGNKIGFEIKGNIPKGLVQL